MAAPDPDDEYLHSKKHQYNRFVKLAAVVAVVVLVGLLILAGVFT